MRNFVVGMFVVDAIGIYALHVRTSEVRWNSVEFDVAAPAVADAQIGDGLVRLPSPPRAAIASGEQSEAKSKLRMAELQPVIFAPIAVSDNAQVDPVFTPSRSAPAASAAAGIIRASNAQPTARFSRAFLELRADEALDPLDVSRPPALEAASMSALPEAVAEPAPVAGSSAELPAMGDGPVLLDALPAPDAPAEPLPVTQRSS